MEREVTDEALFSHRMSTNWAELPQTLRRRQKHRPDILSQFTDFSETSECESRKTDIKPVKIIKRSELLRKFEINDIKIERELSYDDYDDDYKSKNQLSGKLFQVRPKTNFPSMMMMMKNEYKNLSDEERKTNSPDSLLVKSSDSELSSDDYGHTDDSGAFLESQLSRYENMTNPQTNNNLKNKIKLINQNNIDDQSVDARILSNYETKIMSRKNNKEKIIVNKSTENLEQVKDNRKFFNSISPTTPTTTTSSSSYDYENIPRIDMSKININKNSSKQPTIEELRMEIGCELRNSDKKILTNVDNNSQTLEGLIHDMYNDECKKNNKISTIKEEKQDVSSVGGSKLSVREILKRFEELRIQNEMQQQADDKNNDKTLTTIKETLEKLDEKVKRSSNQVYIIYFIN